MPIPVNRPNREPQRPQARPQYEQEGLPPLEEEELLLPEDPSPAPSRPQAPPAAREEDLPDYNRGNLFDDADDETFTTIPPDDDSLYNDEEDWEEEPPAPPQKPSRRPNPKPAPATPVVDLEKEPEEPAPSKKRFGRKDKKALPAGYTDDTFIDEKSEKLKPFGRRRAVKVSDFDSRKNMRQKAKFIQLGVISLLVLLCALGLKNAFFPPASLSADEVATIVQNETGSYGYPLDRGGAFAKDFMQAYLSVSQDPAKKAVNDKALSYFYTGTMNGSVPERVINYKFDQTILYGPTVYETKELTAYSARYTIGALVETGATGSTPPADGSAAKWSFFNVNVYYDKGKDSFLVTPTSPTVVPPLQIDPYTELPDEGKIGTGSPDTQLTQKLKSVVYGFITGYSKSSPTDHTTLDQYVLPNPPADLVKGLSGRYNLAGNIENAIQYAAYPTDDPGVAKVKVTVTWRDGSGDNTIDYKSTYIMTLEKQANGTYLVSKFAPEYFVKKE